MKKNVANQVASTQMRTATDGSDFTSAVVVHVTIDNGSQLLGAVGSGACAHKGHGYHVYIPSQAETNGDLIAFTFHASGAVTETVKYPTSILTGDPVTLIGSPAGGTVGAALAAIATALGTVLTQTVPTTVADAILDRDMSAGTDSGSTVVRTMRQALRFLRNKWSITGGVLTVTKENDSDASWTAVVGTAQSDAVTSLDPAGP